MAALSSADEPMGHLLLSSNELNSVGGGDRRVSIVFSRSPRGMYRNKRGRLATIASLPRGIETISLHGNQLNTLVMSSASL